MTKAIHTERHARLCQLLKKIRKEAGLRQVDIALQIRQSQSFVSKYEAGERRLDIVELEQVCEACGISLSDFVSRFGC